MRGGPSYLAFRNRDPDEVHSVPPVIGALGSLVFFPVMVYHRYTREIHRLYMVLGLAIIVLVVELHDVVFNGVSFEVEEFHPTVGSIRNDHYSWVSARGNRRGGLRYPNGFSINEFFDAGVR